MNDGNKTKNVELELDNDIIRDLIEIYIKENMSNASYQIFKLDNNGFMIAAANAVRNEAIVVAITEGMKHDNLLQT